MSKKKKAKKKNKVVKYRKPFNIAYVFFGAILVYMLIYLYMFLTNVHISGYEVIAGSLATDKQFTGLVLREEEIFSASSTGYIDYYATEGSKVSNASVVYSLDESGRMTEYLQENAEAINLSEDNFLTLKNEIGSFCNRYNKDDFSKVYGFHDTINGNILELSNQTLLNEMEEAAQSDMGVFQRVYAEKSGIVQYYIDGLEDVTPNTVTEEMFDEEKYAPTNLRTVDLVNSGDSVYKLVTSENWTMIIPYQDEMMKDILYNEVTDEEGNVSSKLKSVIEVKFLKDNTTTWGYISLLDVNGQQYLQIDFNNSMVRYTADRYLDIQFIVNDKNGLKIPSSSITTKEFFVIPEECIIRGSSKKNAEGFMVQVFDENGNIAAEPEHITPTFYSITDGMVYIDPNQGEFSSKEPYLKEGDRIRYPNSNEVFQVGRKEKLEGVYCINQGYTQFRKIKVLYANEEYTIVEKGTSYGLTIYDRIVLNAAAVKEDQVIY